MKRFFKRMGIVLALLLVAALVWLNRSGRVGQYQVELTVGGHPLTPTEDLIKAAPGEPAKTEIISQREDVPAVPWRGVEKVREVLADYKRTAVFPPWSRP